jgi:hypothetical protein
MALLEKSAESTEEIQENHVSAAPAPIGVQTMQVRKRSRTHYVICTKKSCYRSSSPWGSETLVSADGVICPLGPPPFSCLLADSAGPLGPVNGAISALGSRDALKCRLLLSTCRSYLSFQNISSGNSRLPSPWLNSIFLSFQFVLFLIYFWSWIPHWFVMFLCCPMLFYIFTPTLSYPAPPNVFNLLSTSLQFLTNRWSPMFGTVSFSYFHIASVSTSLFDCFIFNIFVFSFSVS